MPNDLSDYFASLSEPDKGAVARVVAEVRKLVPDVTEGRSYGMPCLVYRGKALLAVVVRKSWIAAYPYSGKAIAVAEKDLSGFETTSGSVHFTAEHPLPSEAIRALTEARRAEIDNAEPH